jgi:hypothetical protein
MSKDAFRIALALLATAVFGLAFVITEPKQQTKAAPSPFVAAQPNGQLGLKRLAPTVVERQFPGECDSPLVQLIPDKDYVIIHCAFANFGVGPAGNGYYFAWRMR